MTGLRLNQEKGKQGNGGSNQFCIDIEEAKELFRLSISIGALFPELWAGERGQESEENESMSLFQHILGNATEIDAISAHKELSPVLIDQEQIHKAFKLHRDLIVLTNYRIITVDKQGITGAKQSMTSIPYKSIRKFSKESAGLFDMDAELAIWIAGEGAPIKWEFSKGVNINEVYCLLTYFVVLSH